MDLRQSPSSGRSRHKGSPQIPTLAGIAIIIAAMAGVGYGVVSFQVASEAHQPRPQPNSAHPASARTALAPTPLARPKKAEVQVTRVRLLPFTTANGRSAQQVRVDWKNTGPAPVKGVYADIDVYDESGQRLRSGARDTCIFVAERQQAVVAPGKTYATPERETFILIPDYGHAARVKVAVTHVDSGPL